MSPAAAGFLSVAPGFGQIASGRAARGIFWLAAMGFLTHLTARTGGASLPLLLGGWVLNIVDAIFVARKARANSVATGQVQAASVEPMNVDERSTNEKSSFPDRIFLALLMLGIGTIMVLKHRGETDLSVTVMWPAGFLLLIAMLIGTRISQRNERRTRLRNLKAKAVAAPPPPFEEAELVSAPGDVASVVYARALCGYCGHPLPSTTVPLERCPSCATKFRTQRATAQAASINATKPPRVKVSVVRVQPPRDPAIATLLSAVLPGSGQVYNGQLFKGLFVVATCWLVIPWLFGILDAYVTAKRANTIGAQGVA